MTLQTKLTELYTPFVNLDCEVNHYRRGKTNRFVVWAEDGEDASFSSDNHKTEQQLTGVVFVAGLESLEEGFSVVGEIAIVLAGAFPLVFVITKLLRKPLLALGKLLGINDAAAAGLIPAAAASH